jgi:hypothetical protein
MNDRPLSALKEHSNWRYRKLMFNEFVLVGRPLIPQV